MPDAHWNPRRADTTSITMLALDDEALARLIIGATAVPHEKRGQWLKDLAHRIESAPRAADTANETHHRDQRRARQGSSARERQRRCRARHKAGEVQIVVTVPEADLI